MVNDLGGNVDGTGDLSPAEQVVEEIKGMGGEAISNGDSVADWEGAQRLELGDRSVRRSPRGRQQRRHPAGSGPRQHDRGGVTPSSTST
ncbi:MAG: hypothetical protein R2705_22890 [Ilumatobacteraceae bacterium]